MPEILLHENLIFYRTISSEKVKQRPTNGVMTNSMIIIL